MKRSPRAEAAVVLGRVLRSGAYSNVLLAGLGTGPDAALVRRLVYGTLRQLGRIDRILADAVDRSLSDVEPAVLDLLRVGAWELRLGGGAPHAAVHEAVEAARKASGERAAGFVNAVLRKVQIGKEELPAGLPGKAIELGVDPWVYRNLIDAWGQPEAEAFLAASLQPAPRTARSRSVGAGAGRPIPGIAGAVETGADLKGSEPMDPSSVAVGLAVGARPGMVILDLAAAPGGKTLHLHDQLEGRGLVIGADRHARRLATAARRFERLGVDIPMVVADGRHPPFATASFDRVLLDAPCTGLGTLRRRPEIRHRLQPDSPGRAGALQRQLLSAALRLVKPDGLVVYAVCTVFPEETTEVVANARAEPPAGLPGRRAGNGWLLGPHLTGSDGMFISLVRP